MRLLKVLASLCVVVTASGWMSLPLLAQSVPHRLIQGEAEVRGRRNGSSYIARPRDLLYDWFIIRPLPGHDVKVDCAYGPDEPVHRETSLERICTNSNSSISENNIHRGDNRLPIYGGVDESTPYIVNPRRTYVLQDNSESDRVLLVWNHVTGVESYTIQVMDSEGASIDLGSIEVTDENLIQFEETTLFIIEVDLELVEGRKYLPIVTTPSTSSQDECIFGAGISAEECRRTSVYDGLDGIDRRLIYNREDLRGWGFEVLPEELSQRLQEGLSQLSEQINQSRIQGSPWTEEEQILAKVNLYSEYELVSDAIRILREAIDAGIETPLLYQKLGDLYGHVGLNLLAEASYQKIFNLGETDESLSLEHQALGHVSLANLYRVMERTEVAFHLNEAQQVCRDLNSLHGISPEEPTFEAQVTCGGFPEIEARRSENLSSNQ